MSLEFAVSDETRMRLPSAGDAQELFALIDRNRSHLRPWMSWLDATTCVDDVRTFIQSAQDQTANNQGPVCVILHGDVLVGICGYKPIDCKDRSGELGYWLAEPFTGRGIMTVCVRTLINYAFEALQLNRIEIRAATANHGSRGIAERLGLTHKGTFRDAEWVNDHFVDKEVYSVLRREWHSAQSLAADGEDAAAEG